MAVRYDTTLYAEEQSSAVVPSCTCSCLKTFFDYLISANRLFTTQSANLMVGQIVALANQAGYNLNVNDCKILAINATKPFYAITSNSTDTVYRAKIGDCYLSLKSVNSSAVTFSTLKSKECGDSMKLDFSVNGSAITFDTLVKRLYVTRSMIFDLGSFRDTASTKLIQNGPNQGRRMTNFIFDSLYTIPSSATIISGILSLYADSTGHNPPSYTDAHTTSSQSSPLKPVYMLRPATPWYYSSSGSVLNGWRTPSYTPNITSHFQNISVDITGTVERWFYTPSRGGDGFNAGMSLLDDAPYPYNGSPYNAITRYSTFCSQRNSSTSKRPTLDVTYRVPRSTTVARLQIDSCLSCDSVSSISCYSAITDTIVNPYVYGILGNYKPNKSYTYYSERGQSNPSAITNIKTDGAFADFASFWNFQGQGVKPQYNATKWVWNSEMTLFNRKGFELENKDPLGRYNSGIYGYGAALPVAVAQNSRYREVAFEGFEDYSYGTNTCDTLCPTGRHFDLSAFKVFIDSTQRHTGKYSLRVNAGDTISFASAVNGDSFTEPPLNFTLSSNTCISNYLTSIKSNQNALIPTFSPINNKRVVISMWVKESRDCKCESYTGNKILVNVIRSNGTSTYQFTPEGAIIEGWQRYEAVVELPSTTQNLSVSLISIGTSTVYFDDIRIHPFNSNMKSFIYHPLNLRLMAELDENNYATFFEYDDDGTLIRVKKETARGIKTIKETRTGLLKDN